MELNNIKPFCTSVIEVLPQLGFQNIVLGDYIEKSQNIMADGVVLTLGIVGDKKGNVVYVIDEEGAKKIASTMMMGMPVDSLDDMAKSALSELSNMLTANASINFSKESIMVDISPPTMLYGNNIELCMTQDMVTSATFDIDGINLEINITLE